MDYEQGKVKVVWIERDPNFIYSKLFEDEKEALKFAEKLTDFIVFSLVSQKNMGGI